MRDFQVMARPAPGTLHSCTLEVCFAVAMDRTVMPNVPPCDEDLVRRLPLPLAQLYRRAHNARAPLERHQAAFYLWEAAVKLLGATAVIAYAERGVPDPDCAERLKNLARPALGHWWEFVRCLVP